MFTAIVIATCISLLFACATAGDCPDLTAMTTAAQLSAIPASCFGSYDLYALAKLPGEACSGFTTAQGEKLGYAVQFACSGLSAECAGNFSTAGAAGLCSFCLSSVSADFLGHLPPSRVTAIPPASFGGLTKDNVRGFGANCAGTTSAQLEKVGYYGGNVCTYLSVECGSNLPDDAVSGFGSSCASQMNALFTGSLSAGAISHFSVAAFKSLEANALAGLGANCAGLSSEQVAAFGYYSSASCSSISEACAQAIPAAALGGLTSACFSATATPFIQALSAAQVTGISSDAFKGLASSAVGFGANCAGLTAAQMGNLGYYDNKICGYFSGTCGAAVPAEATSSITSACSGSFTVPFMAALGVEAIKHMSVSAFKGLTKNVAGLAASCAGITHDQADGLGYYDGAICSALSAQCGAAFSTAGLSGLTNGCATSLTATFTASLSATQLGALSVSAARGLTDGALSGLADSCSGFTADQADALGYYDSRACSGLTAACGSHFSLAGLSALTSGCGGTLTANFLGCSLCRPIA